MSLLAIEYLDTVRITPELAIKKQSIGVATKVCTHGLVI
jgi:hypothetical protein